MRVRVLRAEARAACVPTEVMQLVIVVGKIYLADELAISGGTRIDVDNAHGVALPILADVEQRVLGDAFRRGLHGHARRRVKGWIRHHGHIHILLGQRVTAKHLTRLGSTRRDTVTRRYEQATTNHSRELWKGNGRNADQDLTIRVCSRNPRTRTWVIVSTNRPPITGLAFPKLVSRHTGAKKARRDCDRQSYFTPTGREIADEPGV